MQPELPATANNSCHVSRDFVWLSGGGDEGDLATHNGSVKKDIIILSLPGSPFYKTFAITMLT